MLSLLMRSYDNVALTHQALILLYGTAWAFDLGWLSLWALLHTQELYHRIGGGGGGGMEMAARKIESMEAR